MILDIIAGIFISILSGMGIGGGGLLVLYLVFVKNMAQQSAQGLNLLFFIAASFSALIYHFKKRKIDKRLLVLLIIPGLLGAVIGSITANAIDPLIVRRIFGWLSVISGAVVLIDKKT